LGTVIRLSTSAVTCSRIVSGGILIMDILPAFTGLFRAKLFISSEVLHFLLTFTGFYRKLRTVALALREPPYVVYGFPMVWRIKSEH
jgi:hypothetical protein